MPPCDRCRSSCLHCTRRTLLSLLLRPPGSQSSFQRWRASLNFPGRPKIFWRESWQSRNIAQKNFGFGSSVFGGRKKLAMDFRAIWSGLSESNRHLSLGKDRVVKSNALEWRHLAVRRGLLIGKWMENEIRNNERRNHFSFAYSAFAAMRTGMSGSASFQRVRKS